jgi:hypothetical protein
MRKGWVNAEIYTYNIQTWMGGDALNSVSLAAGNQTFAGDAERPIYWPVVNELNPLEGVRC